MYIHTYIHTYIIVCICIVCKLGNNSLHMLGTNALFNNKLTILDRVLPHEGKSRRLRNTVWSELRARIERCLADLNKAEVITKGL